MNENEKIPFLSFSEINREFKKEALQTFETFFDERWYILGKGVEEFENRYAEFNQVKYTVGVSNGLDALHLCLRALGVGPGDEVIVPSNTFIATVLAVDYVGATPVFVEPDHETYNIGPQNIRQAITNRTKVIIPVHLYGQACEMDSIIKIAESHNLHILEDNAQAQGASWKERPTGSFGIANATSFYPGKNLGAFGDAGAVTTNDEYIYRQLIKLRNYGSEKKYCHEIIGFNNRMDEIQAQLLNLKLPLLEKWNATRNDIARFYNEAFASIPEIITPKIAKGASSVYHLYVIRTTNREGLKSYLNSNGVGTLIHYPNPPHLQQAFHHLGYGSGDFPIAEDIAKTCLSLPIYPGLSEVQLNRIQKLIQSYFRG